MQDQDAQLAAEIQEGENTWLEQGEFFLCEAVTGDNVSVNEDDDVPALPTSEKKSEPEQKSKEKAGKKRKQPKLTSANKMEVLWTNFFNFSKSPRDDSWNLKNEEINKKPSKKGKYDDWKKNRMRNGKTFFCVLCKPLHRLVASNQFRS